VIRGLDGIENLAASWHTYFGGLTQWDAPKRLAMIFAPQSMSLSESPCTTNAQLFSAALWDIASTIDPTGLSDGLDWYFNLSN
jgi:hypothetical protein